MTCDPFVRFAEWFEAARKTEPGLAEACCLATADADGLPDARMVLLKDFGPNGFFFYGNRESAKGRALAENPRAALVFHWKSLRRQVRVRGEVCEAAPEVADAYWKTRPRAYQIGAWASPQSRPIPGRYVLVARAAVFATRFLGRPVPRPSHWIGWRLVPAAFEFWIERPGRLHDRFLYEAEGGGWRVRRLAP